ncbi:hypothetical protein D9758_009808 [Tetrapyrgos nigripes]|uniref:Bacteriophage T5 Orf172 DNA-binding domain-containing protein n=1 Tax=Tetrapyrgos nigripes TaxID=182062 RepID=A0A8H5GKK7_9AGAR|nr:hypothetical protein D9758_009808 [Tetrapyrgos nigripes]
MEGSGGTKSAADVLSVLPEAGDVDGRSEDPAENMEITASCVSEPNPQSSPMDVVLTRPKAGDGWRMVGGWVVTLRQTTDKHLAAPTSVHANLPTLQTPTCSHGSCSMRASMPMSSVAASASTSSGTDSVVYVFALNEGSGKLKYKIGSTGRTPETRLREWRRGHQSKGFRLVYSVKVVGRNTAYVVEHEAHRQILQYATKIHRSCPDCLVVHQEEFVMELDFGLEDVRNAVATAKRLVETRRVGCT